MSDEQYEVIFCIIYIGVMFWLLFAVYNCFDNIKTIKQETVLIREILEEIKKK